jgi:hypothetical protein
MTILVRPPSKPSARFARQYQPKPRQLSRRTTLLAALFCAGTAGVATAWAADEPYRPICKKGAIWNGVRCVDQSQLRFCDGLPKTQGALCSTVVEKRSKLADAYAAKHRLSAADQKRVYRRVYAAMRVSGDAIRRYKVRTDLICKVRDTGELTTCTCDYVRRPIRRGRMGHLRRSMDRRHPWRRVP